MRDLRDDGCDLAIPFICRRTATDQSVRIPPVNNLAYRDKSSIVVGASTHDVMIKYPSHASTAFYLRGADGGALTAVQSMIVGPGATAEIVDQNGLEVVKLQPCQLVTNLSKLVANTPAFRVEVKEA